MDNVDFILAFESEELSPRQIIDGFSGLVKSGLAWQLQGFYGRTAKALIEAGYLAQDGTVLGYPEEVK